MLSLAKSENATDAARNSNSLSYFAMEAYANDIAIPGEGCPGKAPEHDHNDHDHAEASSTTVNSSAAASTVAPIRVIPAATSMAQATAKATETETKIKEGQDCHTHDDGEVHCP